MATFTCGEVSATKSALAVVTGHATLAAAGRVMVQCFRHRDLPALQLARAHLMAFVAGNFRVSGVTEAHFEGRHHLGRA